MMSDHLLPDVITYSAAISACEKGVQWQRALGLLEMMLRAELVPDTFSYGAVFTACEKGMQCRRTSLHAGRCDSGVWASVVPSGPRPSVSLVL